MLMTSLNQEQKIATTKLSLLLLKHEPDKRHTYSEALDPSLKILDLQQVTTTWYDWHMCMQWFPSPSPRMRGPGDEAMERRWGRGGGLGGFTIALFLTVCGPE